MCHMQDGTAFAYVENKSVWDDYFNAQTSYTNTVEVGSPRTQGVLSRTVLE